MRVLNFAASPADKATFNQIYVSCVMSPLQLRDRAQQKLHGKLLDKLESIGILRTAKDIGLVDADGKPRDYNATDVKLYTTDGGSVALEDTEYELAKEHCIAAIPVTHKALSRVLEAAITWLEAIPETKAEPPADAAKV